jgi:flagellar motor switch protein FliG
MPFRAGIKEAAKMLAGLDLQQRENILELIVQKDPKIAEILKKNIVTLEDLKWATTKMLQEFLREVSLKDLGLALRVASPEAQDHIRNSISSSMREEIDFFLKGKPQPVANVQKAYQGIVDLMLKKVEQGQLVLKVEGEQMV